MSRTNRFHDSRPDEFVMTHKGRQYRGYAFARDREQGLATMKLLNRCGIPAILIRRHAGVAGKEVTAYLADLYAVALPLALTPVETPDLLTLQTLLTLARETLGAWIEQAPEQSK